MNPSPITPATPLPANAKEMMGVPSTPNSNIAEIHDLFSDLDSSIAQDSRMLRQFNTSRGERETNAVKRCEDVKDESTAAGITIGDALSQAKTDKDAVSLDAVQRQRLGLDPDPQRNYTRADVMEHINSRASALDSGTESIFDPPRTQIADKKAQISEGGRRETDENTYITLRSTVAQLSRRQIEALNFPAAVNSIRTVIETQRAPSWWRQSVIATVQQADITNRATMEAVAELQGIPQFIGAVPEIAEKALTASRNLREVKIKEARENKRTLHTERQNSMEEDIYNAAVAAGERNFGERVGQNGDQSQNITMAIPGQEDRSVELPIQDLLNTQAYKARYGREATGAWDTSTIVQNLRALRRITGDPELFNAVVDQYLTRANLTDMTGYTQQDYAEDNDPNGWVNNWRQTIRRSIDGYAIGLVRGAATFEPKQPGDAHGMKAFFDRREMVATEALGLLFGENDFATAEGRKQIMGTGAYGEQALRRIGLMRKEILSSGGPPAERMTAFINAGGARDKAVELTKKLMDEMQKAAKKQLQEQERLLQQVNETASALRTKLTEAQGQKEQVHDAELFFHETVSMQTELLAAKDYVIIQKNPPSITVHPLAAIRVAGERTKFDKQLDTERKRRPPNPQAIEAARSSVQRCELEALFIARLPQQLKNNNYNDVRSELRSGALGTSRSVQVLDTWAYTRKGEGESNGVTKSTKEELVEKRKKIYGEKTGEYDLAVQACTEFQAQVQTAITDSGIDRGGLHKRGQELVKQLERLGYNTKELTASFKPPLTEGGENYTLNNRLDAIVYNLMHNSVLPGITKAGMVTTR